MKKLKLFNTLIYQKNYGLNPAFLRYKKIRLSIEKYKYAWQFIFKRHK